MSQQAYNRSDDLLNQLSDSDGMWGPLLSFRPAKSRRLSCFRALALAAVFGGFYGTALSLVLALLCRASGHSLPPLYPAPTVLTFVFFTGLQFALGPAWNRRAHLLARREVYLQRSAEQVSP